jgi:hypothetical protein
MRQSEVSQKSVRSQSESVRVSRRLTVNHWDQESFLRTLSHYFSFLGYRTTPILYVNGERVSEDLTKKARSNQTLLSFLRDVMRLTGSKLGCAEGGCGACTVM